MVVAQGSAREGVDDHPRWAAADSDAGCARLRRRAGGRVACRVPGRPVGLQRDSYRCDRHRDAAGLGGADDVHRHVGMALSAPDAVAVRGDADDRHRHRLRNLDHVRRALGSGGDRHDEPQRQRCERRPADRAIVAAVDDERQEPHACLRPLHLPRRIVGGARSPLGRRTGTSGLEGQFGVHRLRRWRAL